MHRRAFVGVWLLGGFLACDGESDSGQGAAIMIEPAAVTLRTGAEQVFVATTRDGRSATVVWSVLDPEGGSVTQTGGYTAPNVPGVFILRATNIANRAFFADAHVTVAEGITIEIAPRDVSLEASAQQHFTATVTGATNQEVVWSVEEAGGGSISPDGTYTAPEVAGTFHVVAKSVVEASSGDRVQVFVREPVVVRVLPNAASLAFGEQRTFEASVTGTTDTAVTWSVVELDGGTITEDGTYTAPSVAGTFQVVATSVADPRHSATAAVTVRPPVEVEITVEVAPASASLEFGESLAFTASVAGAADTSVTWSVAEPNGGNINSDGTYTAPSVAGIFHVVATSVADPRRSATATVSVREPIQVIVLPGYVELEFGQQQRFTAKVIGSTDQAVTWSVTEPAGGTISGDGLYTAPSVVETFHVAATSVADPESRATATVDVRNRGTTIDLGILPPDRRVSWNPGIPGGIPEVRQLFATLSDLPTDGTGDVGAAISKAIVDAHSDYLSSGVIQEVVLPEGTFRTTTSIKISRSGVVLRGQGMGRTTLRYDGPDGVPAMYIGRARWTDYRAAHGPFPLSRDGLRGSNEIVLANANATRIEIGDILGIDEEDDTSFVRIGNAVYEKRQPNMDTNGPPLRGAGLWRSVTSLIRVAGKAVGATETTLTLAEPLRMPFRTARYAEVFHVATEYSAQRPNYDGVHHAGIEELTFTGGVLTTNNIAFCWIQNVEADGNPGTSYPGTYSNRGGISGRSIELFHAYRCEVRGSYIHHSRNITQGGGAYLLSLSSYTSESLVEDNIVVFGNKLIVGNMMGGGNVISYNYVDNARTNHDTWQEGAIDLNHQSFTHTALAEGNWATNLGSDTTHGNAGWHVFYRNYGTGQNSAPIYGPYPYTSGYPDASNRRAAGVDGYHRESTYVANVLVAGPGKQAYQIDHATVGLGGVAAIWRVGWGVDGDGGTADDGTALELMVRHGNWDSVTGIVQWDPEIEERTLPDSLYRRTKPAFFGTTDWPWIDPTGITEGDRVKALPAKQRFDRLVKDGLLP